jgi:hypothetical protein
MIPFADSIYHYPVQTETEIHCFVNKQPDVNPLNATILQSSIPDWVQPVDLPSQSDPQNPYLLNDYQYDIATRTEFCHWVYKIDNLIVAENRSNLSIPFDPTCQTLRIHECKIFRNGRWIDILDMNDLRVIQREKNLDDLLYDGNVTALLFLKDVRPGDLLDYSYSVAGSKISGFSSLFHMQFSNRWEKIFGRIIKPSQQTFQTRINPENWSRYLREDEHQWVWDIEPCLPYEIESNQPPGFRNGAAIEISQFSNWNEAARQRIEFYRLNDDLKQDSEAVALVASWQASSADLEEQAIQALRFVQDEIRFLGVEEGMSAFTPSDPLDTLKRRYGDCKGKTQLLRAFLSLLGISSDACLVDTKMKGSVKNRLPTPFFNHVITCIYLPGRTVFVDPTMMYVGGDLSQAICPYGYGLVLNEKTQDLTEIPMPMIHPEVDCTTLFNIQSEDRVEMTIQAQFYGKMANEVRFRIKKSGLKIFMEPTQANLKSQFGSIEMITPVEIDDDRAANHFTLKASLLLKNPYKKTVKKRGKTFEYSPLFLNEYFMQSININRKTPLQLSHKRVKETVVVQGGSIMTPSDAIDHKVFSLAARAMKPDTIEFELLTRLDSVDAEDLPSLKDKLAEGADAIEVIVKSK